METQLVRSMVGTVHATDGLSFAILRVPGRPPRHGPRTMLGTPARTVSSAGEFRGRDRMATMSSRGGSPNIGSLRPETVGTPAGSVGHRAAPQDGGSTAPGHSARAAWPVRVFRLGDEPSDNLSDHTTAEERLAMMWPLAVAAWTAGGRPLPEHARQHMPVRIIRGAGPEPPER